jgi:2-polyprenyl-3-methyl-5-hydroxy-6-metoxy-1,4-benzoquinol methylase
MPEGVYRFARCRACGTLYVDSDVTDEYLRHIYTQESPEAVEAMIGGMEHRQIVAVRLPEFRRHWNAMRRLRPPRPGDQLVDVGCQTGDFGRIAQSDGVQPHGVELSTAFAATCRRLWGPAALVHEGNCLDAPFRRGRFQYVSAFETLEHLCDPVQVLRQVREWLSPDGIVALSVPSSDYFQFKFWLLRSSPIASGLDRTLHRHLVRGTDNVLPHTHIYNFTDAGLRLILDRSGYEPVHIGPTGWHGRTRALAAPLSGLAFQLTRTATGSAIAIAPSLFALARPVAS